MFKILITDDDAAICDGLIRNLKTDSRIFETSHSLEDMGTRLESFKPNLMLLDIGFGSKSALDRLPAIFRKHPGLIVAIITGQGTIQNAIHSLRLGASHFFVKPFTSDEIEHYLQTVEQQFFDHRLFRHSQLNLASHEKFICRSPAMFKTMKLIQVAAESDTNVLLAGETGTGKTFFAEHIHAIGSRAKHPFVDCNCATFNRDLIESELFGYEKGAFTGALQRKEGLMESAGGGTLFLDEIGDLPLETQPKLLKAIDQKTIRRVGGLKSIPIDVRFIAASNRDLKQEVQKGRFRDDLLYRLNILTITIPPLRERSEDLLPLSEHLIQILWKKMGFPAAPPPFPDDLVHRMKTYGWPGNIRELYHTLERMLLMGKQRCFDPDFLPDFLSNSTSSDSFPAQSLKSFEKEKILRMLRSTGWNKKKSAEKLGISRETLYRKIRKYNLKRD